MQKWKYHVVVFDNADTSLDLETELDSLGDLGWEVTATIPGDANDFAKIILKRPNGET